jgi:hypothetical protein
MSPLSNPSPLQFEPVSWRHRLGGRETEFQGQRQVLKKRKIPATETKLAEQFNANPLISI